MNYEEILNKNNELIDLYKRTKIEKEILEKNLKLEQEKIKQYEKDISIYDKKKILLNEASTKARNLSKEIFEAISTNALQTILGENLSVYIDFGKSGGNTTADFYIKSNYSDELEVMVDPTNEDGGGAADIIALSSFLTINSLLSEQNSAVIALDEPTKYVSEGNAIDVSRFLKNITKDLNKQIIMVTHDKVSKEIADKAYFIKLDENGTSIIEDITKET